MRLEGGAKGQTIKWSLPVHIYRHGENIGKLCWKNVVDSRKLFLIFAFEVDILYIEHFNAM